jgi:hypothetical protein
MAARQAGEGAASNQKGQRETHEILADLRGRDPEEILTTLQVVEITGVTQQTVFNWIKRKESPLVASKPGREWRIRVGDLIDFLSRKALRDGDRAEAEVVTTATTVAERGQAIAAAHAPTIFLRFDDAPAATGATESEAGSSNTLQNAFDTAARLLDLAGLGQRWRRAVLTLAAATESGDVDWQRECRESVERLQTDLLRASGLITERMLTLFRYAADEAIEECREKKVSELMLVESTAEEEDDRQAENEFERAKDLLATVFSVWERGGATADQQAAADS